MFAIEKPGGVTGTWLFRRELEIDESANRPNDKASKVFTLPNQPKIDLKVTVIFDEYTTYFERTTKYGCNIVFVSAAVKDDHGGYLTDPEPVHYTFARSNAEPNATYEYVLLPKIRQVISGNDVNADFAALSKLLNDGHGINGVSFANVDFGNEDLIADWREEHLWPSA